MNGDYWWTLALMAIFFIGVHYNLYRRDPADLEQAAMLPFADDPKAAKEMERETGRSHTGCGCPGTCRGECRYRQQLDM